jgi:hypothetical protein
MFSSLSPMRQDYELALGRFMVAFNELDYVLTQILRLILLRLDRNDLVEDCAFKSDFALRLRFLDLLRYSHHGNGIANISIASLRALAQERNVLAHAHFDEDPFDDSYRLIARRKAPSYLPERINGLTAQMAAAVEALRYAETYYLFDHVNEPES